MSLRLQNLCFRVLHSGLSQFLSLHALLCILALRIVLNMETTINVTYFCHFVLLAFLFVVLGGLNIKQLSLAPFQITAEGSSQLKESLYAPLPGN